ncbi:MAG: PQQ-binding-like beta-propeller repeat protein [Anaerolineae bacterium]|nr:PQQ-binding-like beta-propeller repeat protein [Anaerolineae bacterium]
MSKGKRILYWWLIFSGGILLGCGVPLMVVRLLSPPEIGTSQHMSELTLEAPYLYFGAGYCLYRLQLPDQHLEAILCTADWTFEKPVISGQRAYVQVARYPRRGEYFVAIDLAAGTKRRQITEARFDAYFTGLKKHIRLVGDKVVTARRRGIYVYDGLTGRPVWHTRPVWPDILPYVIYDDWLWYVTDEHTIVALDVNTGQQQQTLDLSPNVLFEQVLYVDEHWLVGRDKQKLLAFKRDQLEMAAWSTVLDIRGGVSMPPVLRKNLLLLDDFNATYALDITTGEVVWQFTPSDISRSVATYRQNDIVLFRLVEYDDDCSSSGWYALELTSGAKLWEYAVRGGSVNAIVYEGVVYIAHQSAIDALDLATGTLLWQVEVDSTYKFYRDSID